MNTNKHRWTDEEREFISRCYIEEYVLKQKGISQDNFVAGMHNILPQLKENSILMFAENTEQLLREFCIKNCSEFAPLAHYSLAHKKVMEKLLREFDLI